MPALMLTPRVFAGMMTDEPVMTVISIQLPIFMVTIFAAALSLHRMLVSRMAALAALEKSESLNRTILESSPDYTLILDEQGEIVFCNRPNSERDDAPLPIGRNWLPLLPPEDRDAGVQVLSMAATGVRANLVTNH